MPCVEIVTMTSVVAVGRGLGGHVGADAAGRARPVLDDHLLA
jgi:hypothetical protein